MLYISLVLTAILLAATNWSARTRGRAVGLTLGLSLLFNFGPIFLGMVLPPVFFASIGLFVVCVMWVGLGSRRRLFLPMSLCAAAVAWGVIGWDVWKAYADQIELREMLPIVSMDDLLPSEPRPMLVSLPVESVGRLARIEERVHEPNHGYQAYMFRRLHEGTADLFINSPGFGITRMGYITKSRMLERLRKDAPELPGQPSTLPISVSEWRDAMQRKPERELEDLHEDSIVDFVYSDGFGYFKDRQHVAGFQSHRFKEVPTPSAEQWSLQSVQLIGLVLNDVAVAYVSDRLPQMDQLRKSPTRPLDAFETMGLAALSKGEDLFSYEDANGVRLLGALRSTKQCIQCHGGERGDLLGAFSYTLRRTNNQIGK